MKLLILITSILIFKCASPIEPFRECEDISNKTLLAKEGELSIFIEETGEKCEYTGPIDIHNGLWKKEEKINLNSKLPPIIELPPCDSAMIWRVYNGIDTHFGTYYSENQCEKAIYKRDWGNIKNPSCIEIKGCNFRGKY